MRTLEVDLPGYAYPIYIGQGLLTEPALFTKHVQGSRAFVVTNEIVAPLYLAAVTASLQSAGKQVDSIVLADGEGSKNQGTWMSILDALLEKRAERKTTLIALGGGVIGDMAGFAAACYQRGMPFLQIPTTLLSQVDSSVGGKTGINHPLGKNMIGAFYQPRAVIIDTLTLNTLPEREFRSGLAETIKYGLICDSEFFEWQEAQLPKLLAKDPDALSYLIERSCRHKAEVVIRDEREEGERALLNLGHTFGHAIEAGLGYGTWLHGEAVAAGTVCAAELSHRVYGVPQQDVARIRQFFAAAGLPTALPDISFSRYMELMASDKKTLEARIRFVLLKKLGQATVTSEVPLPMLEESMASCKLLGAAHQNRSE